MAEYKTVDLRWPTSKKKEGRGGKGCKGKGLRRVSKEEVGKGVDIAWSGLEVCGNRFFVPIPSHFNDFIPIPIPFPFPSET